MEECAGRMVKEPYEIIYGDNLLSEDHDEAHPIVEGLIYKNDYVLLVASEKVGKTLFGQHLACCLSTGKPFLDTLEIENPKKILYLATEVKRDQLKDRFRAMEAKVGINPNNIALVTTNFKYNDKIGEDKMDKILSEIPWKPDVVIIDALYKAVRGSIRDDDVCSQFHTIVDGLIDKLNCAVVVIHHLRKPSRSSESGNYFKQDDKDTFGSAYLTAGVDHVLRLELCSKDPKDRILKCDTQRSGRIVEIMRLKLDEKSLTYHLANALEEEIDMIYDYIRDNSFSNEGKGVDVQEIMFRTRVGRSTCYKIIKTLVDEGRIEKSGTKTKYHKAI